MELYNGLIQTTKELLAATPFQAWAYDPAGAWEDGGPTSWCWAGTPPMSWGAGATRR